MSREPSGVASSAPASSSAAAERFQSDEVPDHGVKRIRWSPHVDASEISLGDVEHSQEHAREHSRGLKRQPESATEDLEDAGDQGDADDGDMNTIGAVCEEPVITVGVDGENWDECENDAESNVDDVNGGFLDPEMVREARVEELPGYLKMQVYCRLPVAECGSHNVIQTRWVDTNKGTNGLQKFVARWWRRR